MLKVENRSFSINRRCWCHLLLLLRVRRRRKREMCLTKRHYSILQTKCGKRVNRRQIARHARTCVWAVMRQKAFKQMAHSWGDRKRTQSDQSGPETKSHGHFATCRMLYAFRAWKCRKLILLISYFVHFRRKKYKKAKSSQIFLQIRFGDAQ